MTETERLVHLVMTAPKRLRKQAEAALIAGLAAGILARRQKQLAKKPRQERLPLEIPGELKLKQRSHEAEGRRGVSPAKRPAKQRASTKPKPQKQATQGTKSGGQPRPPASTVPKPATRERPRKSKDAKTREGAAAPSKAIVPVRPTGYGSKRWKLASASTAPRRVLALPPHRPPTVETDWYERQRAEARARDEAEGAAWGAKMAAEEAANPKLRAQMAAEEAAVNRAEGFEQALQRYMELLASGPLAHGRTIGSERLRKFVRIFWNEKGGGRSAAAFVDLEHGGIHTAAGWKKPSTGSSGTIYTLKPSAYVEQRRPPLAPAAVHRVHIRSMRDPSTVCGLALGPGVDTGTPHQATCSDCRRIKHAETFQGRQPAPGQPGERFMVAVTMKSGETRYLGGGAYPYPYEPELADKRAAVYKTRAGAEALVSRADPALNPRIVVADRELKSSLGTGMRTPPPPQFHGAEIIRVTPGNVASANEEPIARFEDEENGVEAYVIPHQRGGFATIQKDIDSGNVVSVNLFQKDKTPERAIALARTVLGPQPDTYGKYPAKCGTPADRNKLTVITPQAKDPAHYAVRSASSLIASHNPLTFYPDDRYPTGVQERDYLHDENEQRKVRVEAQNVNPAILIHRSPTPADGPSLVTEDGCALGGNGRLMMLKRAFGDASPGAAAYREALLCDAPEFGLSREEIEKIPDPILVRIIDGTHCNDNPRDLARKVRQYNNALTNAIDDIALGVSLSRQLSPSTISSFGELLASSESSLREKMKDQPRDFARLLEADGILNNQNRSQYQTKDGHLTETAKDQIEGMFLSRALGTAERIRATPPGLLRKVERAVPYITRVAARNPTFDLTPTLVKSVDLINRATNSGKNLEDALSQGGFRASGFGDLPPVDDTTRDMARMLAGEGMNTIRERFKNYATVADYDPNQPRLGGERAPTPAEALAALSTSKPLKGRALFRGATVKQPEGWARIVSTGEGKVTVEFMTGAARGQKQTLTPDQVGEVIG